MSGPSTAARISATRDLLRRTREHVATADAALGADETRTFHREEDLLEVRLGKVGPLGDLLDRRRAIRLVQREREQRACRVVTPGGDLHPTMVAYLPTAGGPKAFKGEGVRSTDESGS